MAGSERDLQRDRENQIRGREGKRCTGSPGGRRGFLG